MEREIRKVLTSGFDSIGKRSGLSSHGFAINTRATRSYPSGKRVRSGGDRPRHVEVYDAEMCYL